MILIFGCDDEEKSAFQIAAKYKDLQVCFISNNLCKADIDALPYGAIISVNHKAPIDAEMIDALYQRGISYISTRSIGVNHINVEYAKKRGICVESIAYSPESVAEHTIMLMLMAVRNILPIIKRSEQGDFRLNAYRASTLSGMTIGIIGTGKIGNSVSHMLQGFGCKLLTYSHTPTADIHYTNLDTLLRKSDIISLHIPLCKETTHFLSKSHISRMKHGAILVNVSRGGLIDTEALESALRNGHLAGAALDVIEGEENYFYQNCFNQRMDIPFFRLASLPNVILTPHCAFYTKQSLSDIVNKTIENCIAHERRTKK